MNKRRASTMAVVPMIIEVYYVMLKLCILCYNYTTIVLFTDNRPTMVTWQIIAYLKFYKYYIFVFTFAVNNLFTLLYDCNLVVIQIKKFGMFWKVLG